MSPQYDQDRPLGWQQELLAGHQLEVSYLGHAQRWFTPLADALAAHQKGAGRPVVVGINGCQGSGKTTLCDYLRGDLEYRHGLRSVCLSLDDFYHTRARRERLAASVHPLLLTRGVPGTHDMALLQRTLDALLHADYPEPIAVPRFDKARDDRRPRAAWEPVEEPVDLVLLEGWCLGARPQTGEELAVAVNALERDEDPDGTWRAHVNSALAREFEPLYRRIDQWAMLRAPSFDRVYCWRLEQERKLAASLVTSVDNGAASRLMDEVQLARFVQYFQRLTVHCLEWLPGRVDHLYLLDEQRQVTEYRRREEGRP